jgi:glutamyl/glutaminyl-tRNA synthetase
MIYNTRFNPTLNGYLHLGHLYNILVNHAEAQATGGKFHVRFDDNQRSWNWRLGKQKIAHYKFETMRDFDWIGIEPAFISQAENEHMVAELMRTEFGYEADPEDFTAPFGAEVIGMPFEFYPVADKLTSEKVVMDYLEGVNLVIRGIDLLTEDCLYRYFTRLFRIPQPRMVYIPRLTFDGSGIVSKTEGNYKLKSYRDKGIAAREIIERLALDCQKVPGLGWRLDNIKPSPVLGAWANDLHP